MRYLVDEEPLGKKSCFPLVVEVRSEVSRVAWKRYLKGVEVIIIIIFFLAVDILLEVLTYKLTVCKAMLFYGKPEMKRKMTL